MEKINFENGTKVKSPYVVIEDVEHEVVPGKYTGNTPLSPYTLNLMQENIEKSCVVVSSTEPTTDEKVWIQKGDNLINLLYCNISNNVATSKVDSNSIEVSSNGGWAFSQVNEYKVVVGEEYTFSANYNNSANINNGIIIYDSNNETLNFQESSETSGKFEITFVTTTEKIKIKFASNNTSDNNTNTVRYTNVQLKRGVSATEYEEYIEPKIYVKNDNGVYEEFVNIDNINNKNGNVSASYDMMKNSNMTDRQTYTLVAEYNLSGNYRDLVDVILFSCTQGNFNALGSCLLEVSIRKDVDSKIAVSLNILCGRIDDINFYAVINHNEECNTSNVKLYVYNNIEYRDVHGKSLSFKSNNSVARQYYTSENYSTALPSGTQVVASGANEKGELQYNSNITDVDVNNWVRTGNVVQVSFRGLVGTDIANSSRLLLLPFRPAREGTPFVFAGTKYTQKTPVFTWMDNDNRNLNCAPITAGNYVHVYFTYICKD